MLYKKAVIAISSVLIVVLVGTIIFACFTIHNKNVNIEKLKSDINKNRDVIENHLSVQKELEDKIKKGESELNDVKSQLEKSKEESNKIKQENDSLKNQIEQLKLQNSKVDKVCYLTFDDGPSDNTLKILKILDDYKVKATFFVVKNSKADYIKQVAARGHTVGLHTASHVYSNIYSSDEAYYADLKVISDIVESQTGKKSNIIRFPGGSSNKISKDFSQGIMTRLTKSVVENGYFYFDWNVDSGDAAGKNVRYDVIRNNVVNSANGKGSICVLMHDTSAKSTTVTALPGIIEGLTAKGYRFEALTQQSFGFRHGELRN